MTDLQEQLRTGLHDRYAIDRELGSGGMATVFLARDLRHDRLVALKVLRPELSQSLGPERFQREIRLAARLQHPHILPVHDSGTAAGQLWYTMPYVEGDSLRARLRREGQLAIEEALLITREVADALAYAHAQGVVHRDIKPENILFSGGHALVADFGVARALEGGDTPLTETGMSVGTPAYMSPEQSLADPRLDGRSDIYSLGCVLYEMLVGEAPYTGPTAQAIIAKRLHDPVPSARRLRETVPVEVDQVLERALAKAPADRYPTATAMMQALRHPGLSERASSPATTAVEARQVRPNRRRLILAGTVVALVVAAVVVGLLLRKPAAGASPKNMLAVLPFKNLGAASDQYFADGLNEEITSRLASVRGLGVISRTSTERYRTTTKPLKQIGRELGADYVLEGSVRWDKSPNGSSRIRVTPQLVQVSDDSHLWADRYDAELADVFSVQTQIAEQVTSALGVALAPVEREVLAAKPTTNLTAYDAYLRGNAAAPPDFTIGAERIVNGLRRAIEHYKDAVRLDSSFALAYAKLGAAYTQLVYFQVDPEANGRAARAAIDRALTLAPTLSDAHAAAGFYQAFVAHDITRSMAELEQARAGRPNDAELLSIIADFEWYQRGPAGRSISFAERSVVLDPESNTRALVLARLYRDVGRFDDAERLYDRVIRRDPKSNGPYVMKAYIYLLRDGDTARARATIRAAARVVDPQELVTAAVTTGGIGTWAALGMLDEPLQRTLLKLEPAAFGDDTAFYGIVKAYALGARGERRVARAYYDSAHAVAERRYRNFPAEPGPLNMLIWTTAVRGDARGAYDLFDRFLKESGLLYFPEKNAWLARIALLAGDTNRALAELETRGWGSDISAPWLCVDGFWASIRHQPRFQRLVAGHCPSVKVPPERPTASP
jgi:serine/threonine-protein kinase